MPVSLLLVHIGANRMIFATMGNEGEFGCAELFFIGNVEMREISPCTPSALNKSCSIWSAERKEVTSVMFACHDSEGGT